MKLVVGLGLAALVLLGCAPKAQKPDGPKLDDNLKVGIVYDRGGLGDKSFNDSAHRGVEMAEKKFGVKVVAFESKEVKDYESNLRELADAGCQLVIAVGIDMMNALEAVAKEFPDTKFAIVDVVVDQPNVRSLQFKEEQGSFLVGYLAGLMTKTNKIGFVGGKKIPLIEKFECGYVAGATLANPAVEPLPSIYTGEWDNIDMAKSAARTLYGKGADIVYHAAGRAGLGVIAAAKESDKFAIGVDSDQDGIEPGYVLTSMIKRVDNAVYQTISDLVTNNWSTGVKTYDLASDGVGYSDLTYTKDKIGIDNIEKLEKMKQQVIDGHILVPSSRAEWEKIKAATPQPAQR